MLEDSVLNEKLIKKIVKEKYFIDVENVFKINRGSANIYSLDNKYILKEFNSHKNVETIIKECKVINHLKNDGFRVPEYVMTKDDESYFIYSNRIIILQKYLEGYSVPNNSGDFEDTMESANILGKLLSSLKKCKLDLKNECFIKYSDLDDCISKINKLIDRIDDNPYKEKIICDLSMKKEIAKKMKEIDFSEFNNLTIMLCHGDFSVQQFIYNDELGTAVIDFETIGMLPVAWEIIRSYSYIDKDASDGTFNLKTFILYVKEVMKYITLNKYDLKYMTTLYIVQLVGSTFGYKQYIEDHTKIELLNFGFFRTNMINYLYNNLELITNELMSLAVD